MGEGKRCMPGEEKVGPRGKKRCMKYLMEGGTRKGKLAAAKSPWIEYVKQYMYDHFPISYKQALVDAAPGYKLLKQGQAWL
jgi:hypothetical protein